jgi:hypothetical protein
LPVVDYFCGLVEDFDPIVVSNPVFGFEFVFEVFPRIFARPEKVGCQRASSFADHLVNGEGNILF